MQNIHSSTGSKSRKIGQLKQLPILSLSPGGLSVGISIHGGNVRCMEKDRAQLTSTDTWSYHTSANHLSAKHFLHRNLPTVLSANYAAQAIGLKRNYK